MHTQSIIAAPEAQGKGAVAVAQKPIAAKPDVLERAKAKADQAADEVLAFLGELDPSGFHSLWVAGVEARGQLAALTFGPTEHTAACMFVCNLDAKGNIHFTANEVGEDLGATKASKDDIVAIRAVWVDIDPQPGIPLDQARAEIRERIEAIPLGRLASFVIDSGGGFQLIYLLAEKVAATPQVKELAEAINRGLIQMFDGDVNAYNVDRLLRAPGTLNIPNARKRANGRIPRRASIVRKSGRRFSLDELAELCPPIYRQEATDKSPRVAELISELEREGYDDADTFADLEDDLRNKVLDDMDAHLHFRRVWNGEKSKGDLSGSGFMASLAQAAGRINEASPGRYSAVDFARLAWVWPYAVQAGDDRETKLDARQLARAWARVSETVDERDEAKAAELRNMLEPQPMEHAPTDAAGKDDDAPNAQAPKAPSRIQIESFEKVAGSALTASALPLVKGVLDQGTLSVMYGPSNVGKTFVAMSVAFHVSTGMAWGGMKATKGAVVYVAAEGGAGARKRAEALRRRYSDVAAGADLHFILSSLDLRRPDADLAPLIAALQDLGRPIILLVLDTLSRVMAGGEENGSTDMGAMVRHFDRIRAATGAHVMVVHHSGKDTARGARGHSLLRAATDTEIEIAERQIVVTKQRDLDKAWSSAFDLPVIQLGVDEDGDPITSCTLELVARQDQPAGTATPSEQVVLEALTDILSDLPEGTWAKASAIAEHLADGEHPFTLTAVRHHLKNLRPKGLVAKLRADQWRPKQPPLPPATWFQPVGLQESPVAGVAEAVAESVFE